MTNTTHPRRATGAEWRWVACLLQQSADTTVAGWGANLATCASTVQDGDELVMHLTTEKLEAIETVVSMARAAEKVEAAA